MTSFARPTAPPSSVQISRRGFIAVALAAPLARAARPGTPATDRRSLAGEIGITTASFVPHLRSDPQLRQTLLLDLPQRLREEFGMRVFDVVTSAMTSFEPRYVDELRGRADRHGCVITNMKLIQDVEIVSPDPALRRRALHVYREMIDVAQRLGCRWVRPSIRGGKPAPDLELLVAGFRELIDYGAPKGVGLVVESLPGGRDDPDAVPRLIARVGPGLSASPDLDGWSAAVRYEGLRKSFPLAVTCDFKAKSIGPNGEHPAYDLKRCFQIGYDAGFRGPWIIEHFHETQDGLWQGFGRVHGWLQQWLHDQPAATKTG